MSTVRRADITRKVGLLNIEAVSKWHFHDKTVYGEKQTFTIHDQERFEAEFLKVAGDYNATVTKSQLLNPILKNLGLGSVPEPLLTSALELHCQQKSSTTTTNEPLRQQNEGKRQDESKLSDEVSEAKANEDVPVDEYRETKQYEESEMEPVATSAEQSPLDSSDSIGNESKISNEDDEAALSSDELKAPEEENSEINVDGHESKEEESLATTNELENRVEDQAEEGTKDDAESRTQTTKVPKKGKKPAQEQQFTMENFHRIVETIYAPSYIFGQLMNRAAARGDLSLLTELLSRGCNPNHVDGRGMNAFHYASERGATSSISHILHSWHGESNIDKADHTGWTPLIYAASRGFSSTVQTLINAGADPNATTQSGRSGMHWAATKGHDGVVSFLLHKSKANKSQRDTSGWTPLHLAVINGATSTIKLLLDAGVDQSITDILGKPARAYCDPKTAELFEAMVKRRGKRAEGTAVAHSRSATPEKHSR